MTPHDANMWSAADEMKVNHVAKFTNVENFEELRGKPAVPCAGVVLI